MGANEISKLVGTMTPQAGAAIELRGIHKRYGATPIVKGVDLLLAPRSFLVLLGPSGCGKSTLLRMLSGLEAPSEGSLHILGREVANGARGVIVPPGERGLGLVFQSYALWPHMTVRGNVEWPLKVARKSAAERTRRANEVLGLMGIGNLADRYPNEISGGQQQRVAIARMLSPAPGLLLFDEPLSNLDAKLRLEMRSELLRVHRTTGATSVYVTHDQVEAMTMATHVAVMRDGLVEQYGTPQELLDNPATAFVATFVGTPAANVIAARKEGGRYCVGGGALCDAQAGANEVQLLYRATDLQLRGAGQGAQAQAGDAPTAKATLVEAAPMAGTHVCTLMLADARISVVAAPPAGAQVGDAVTVVFPAAPRAHFGADGRRITVAA